MSASMSGKYTAWCLDTNCINGVPCGRISEASWKVLGIVMVTVTYV
jgi:hypothetical protein